MFRPGLLTRRYIEGQRARHVSPLALFLFSVFLMFFVFSLTSGSMLEVGVGNAADAAAARAGVRAELDAANAAVARAEAALAQSRRGGQGVADAESELESARAEQRADTVAMKAVEAALALPAATSAVQASPAGLAGLDLGTGNARIDAAIQQARKNPELTLYKLKNSAYKYSFLLVPISLPFLWLMFFWRPGIVMYDHAVFSLYSLSFMSVLFIVMALLEPLHARGLQSFLIVVVVPLHMFMQLLETYRLDPFAALWRTAVLLVLCAVVLLLFLLLILVLTTR